MLSFDEMSCDLSIVGLIASGRLLGTLASTQSGKWPLLWLLVTLHPRDLRDRGDADQRAGEGGGPLLRHPELRRQQSQAADEAGARV